MIKTQFDYYQTEKTPFTRFMDSLHTDPQSGRYGLDVRGALKPYKATLGKSKASYRYNIKFHDPKLYTLFMLRWS
jgi:hypothetical protein